MRTMPTILLIALLILFGCGQSGDPGAGVNDLSKIVQSAPEKEGMAFIRGGEFTFTLFDESKSVLVNSFYLDICPVTIADFAEFVEATGYVPLSDNPEHKAVYLKELDSLAPHFQRFFANTTVARKSGITWRHDERGNLRDSSDWRFYPVVHVSLDDARAYARWRGKRLPNMYEWQYAALTGMELEDYSDRIEENVWHAGNSEVIMPVGIGVPNARGIYDLIGNINEYVEQGDYRFSYEGVPDSSRISIYSVSSFINEVKQLYPPSFFLASRGVPGYDTGFRCAMDVR